MRRIYEYNINNLQDAVEAPRVKKIEWSLYSNTFIIRGDLIPALNFNTLEFRNAILKM